MQVLHHEFDGEAGVEGPGQHVVRPLVLRRAAAPAGPVDDLQHDRRVEPEPLAGEDRLGAGQQVRGGHEVVQRLQRVPGAHGAHVPGPAHRLEHRPHGPHGVVRAARHDGQRARAGAGDAARHGRVHQHLAVVGEGRGQRHRAGRLRGAHVDEHRAGFERLGQAVTDDGLHHGRVRQDEQHDLRARGRVRRGAGDLRARDGRRERFQGRGRDVVSAHPRTGRAQQGGHRDAHVAQPDDADRTPVQRAGHDRPPARPSPSRSSPSTRSATRKDSSAAGAPQ